jgi:hypothetical protein
MWLLLEKKCRKDWQAKAATTAEYRDLQSPEKT